MCESETIEALDADITRLFAAAFALTARALARLGEFERRQGWAQLGFQSCAHWLNFRVGISLGAAREHVRVALALADLPATSARFSAGTLSYSKVRALTRIATAGNEAELCAMADAMTAAQLERVVRVSKRVSSEQAHEQIKDRRVEMGFDADGMFFLRARLMPDEGARLMQTIDRLSPEDSSRTVDARRADALMALGSERTRTELVLHIAADADACVETSAGRVSVSAETARRLSCDASVIAMRQDDHGRVLDVGRKSRKVSAAMRRALSERDRGCRFPGCANQVVDHHHVEHWQDGGETIAANLMQLCRWHHTQIHEGGYRVALAPDGTATFFDPKGSAVQPPRPLPAVASDFDGGAAQLAASRWLGVDWSWRQIDYGLVVSTIVDRRAPAPQ